MTKEQATNCVVFLVIVVAALCGYVESRTYHFKLNDQSFEQIGVMATTIDGQTVYVPIFRRVN